MKPPVLTLFILLCAYLCHAQNYQCLRPGQTHYFINSNGYLRSIRIDSVRTVGGDTIYYPFQTARRWHSTYPPSVYSLHGSWLGGAVIKKPDGTFVFDNIWQDSVVVKTQASLGDSWMFFQDSSSRYYEATISAIDTMSVLGMLDSIKVITLAAMSGSSVVTTDSFNNFNIILSKNNGFVSVCDLYTFPYHHYDTVYVPGQVDIYLDSVCRGAMPGLSNALFTLTKYEPSGLNIYNFNAGDVFFTSVSSTGGGGSREEGYYDSIMGKTIVDPYRTKYGVYTKHIDNQVNFHHNTHIDENTYIDSISVDTSWVFNNGYLPEEIGHDIFYRSDIIYYYFPNDTTMCSTGKRYNFGVFAPPFEILCIATPMYKEGFLPVYKDSCWTEDGVYFYYTHSTLLSSVKNGITCGIPPNVLINLKVPDITTGHFELYPNPVNSVLTVSSAVLPISQVIITNLLGQIVYTRSCHTQKAEIDVAALQAGVYLIKINGTEMKKFVKE